MIFAQNKSSIPCEELEVTTGTSNKIYLANITGLPSIVRTSLNTYFEALRYKVLIQPKKSTRSANF